MAVDRGYGTGSARSAANSASRRNSAASAGLRKKGIKKAGRKYTSTATAKAKSVSGSSDYVARENAARTQLGTAGVAARARQFPTAARATARGLVREVTGVDISRKGVSVSPESLAMALPIGKVVKAARALRAAGKIIQASALEARVAAKAGGKKYGGLDQGLPINTSIDVGSNARRASESLYPKLPSYSVPGTKRSFDIYEDPYLEGAGRFARGTKRGNQLVKAIEKNEVQQGFYVGQREAVKRAAFNSKVKPFPIPKRGR